MTLWSNSSWHTYSTCPRAWGYRYRDGIAPREPAEYLTAGTAWHDVTRAILRGGLPPEDDMTQHWITHNLRRYPIAPMAHEVCYYLDKSGRLTRPRKHGLVGVIDTVATGDDLWIIERKTAATLRGWHHYRATTQYWSYVAVADEVLRLTGKRVRIAYDEVRKAEPREPKGTQCKKCKGLGCAACGGTGDGGISKAVTEFTPEILAAWLEARPWIDGTDAMEACIARGDVWNAWYEDTEEDREYVRARFAGLIRVMRATRIRTEPNYNDCGRCQYLELCWHENTILYQWAPAEWSTGVHSEDLATMIGVKRNARKS